VTALATNTLMLLA